MIHRGPDVEHDYTVGDCLTISAVCKTTYENASKIAINATCLLFVLGYLDVSVFVEAF